MTLYEVLGVDPAADAATVRRAYLELARRHHPDADGGDAERMLQVNEAWSVLGDPRARAAYDATLPVQASRAIASKPAQGFVPLDDDGDDQSEAALEAWRLGEDVGDPRTAPGRGVVAAPIVLASAAAAVGTVWLVTAHRAALVGAVLLGAASLVGFLVAPLVAMAKASRYERGD